MIKNIASPVNSLHSERIASRLAGPSTAFVEAEDLEGDHVDALPALQKLDITAQDIALVSEQIAYAFAGIRNLAFQRGCHDPQCTWCQLVDKHILPESLTPGGEDPDEAMEG